MLCCASPPSTAAPRPRSTARSAAYRPIVSTDPKTGQSYYTARILVPEAEHAQLGAVRLVPGMPVEAFLQIGERCVLSYLVKPLTDQIAKSWREN